VGAVVGLSVVGLSVVGAVEGCPVGEDEGTPVVGFVLGIEVVGLLVGVPVVGFEVVGLLVGIEVVGLFVGARVVGTLVGLRVVGTLVGLRVVGTLVGLRVVGLDVGFEVVGLGVHPISFDGTGKHALLRQVFVVQPMPSLQPESSMHGSSARRILRNTLFTRDDLSLMTSVAQVRGKQYAK